jgi:hypothetical protein
MGVADCSPHLAQVIADRGAEFIQLAGAAAMRQRIPVA